MGDVAALRQQRVQLVVSNPVHVAYPRKMRGSMRPFRFWDAHERKEVQYRCYKRELRALQGAALALLFAKVGTVYEVFDIRTARHVATFRVGISSDGHPCTLYTPVSTRYVIKEA